MQLESKTSRKDMDQKQIEKEHDLLEVACDQQTTDMLAYINYNWEVAASRMALITEDRQLGRYDDDGMEAMAVFSRLERVLTAMFAIVNRPQATLLGAYREQLQQMAADRRLDRGITEMMSAKAKDYAIQAPTIWKRLIDLYPQSVKHQHEDKAIVHELYQKNYLPNMELEDALKTMQAMVSNTDPTEEQTKIEKAEMENLAFFGEQIGKVAAESQRLMALGMATVQMAVRLILPCVDLHQKSDAEVDQLFQDAKQELLKSDTWKTYWRSHIGHLSQKGSIKTELHDDAEEVEQELLDVHRYLYTKMEESAEAFGRALKEAALSDEAMLRLLWLTAKKEAIQKESGSHTPERALMEKGVGEAARKLYELAADKYYHDYGEIWDDIMLNDIIASQLMNYNGGVHNAGFNMQVFCNIVGWLQREYHFYGSNSSVVLGKTLNNGKISDTFKKYIGARETILNQQTISELTSMIEKKRN